MSETVTKKLMLFFPRFESEKPIIYHLVKDHNLVVNVYRAKVTPEEEGYVVLDVTGTEEDIQGGIDFVKTFDVVINPTGKGAPWGEAEEWLKQQSDWLPANDLGPWAEDDGGPPHPSLMFVPVRPADDEVLERYTVLEYPMENDQIAAAAEVLP